VNIGTVAIGHALTGVKMIRRNQQALLTAAPFACDHLPNSMMGEISIIVSTRGGTTDYCFRRRVRPKIAGAVCCVFVAVEVMKRQYHTLSTTSVFVLVLVPSMTTMSGTEFGTTKSLFIDVAGT